MDPNNFLLQLLTLLLLFSISPTTQQQSHLLISTVDLNALRQIKSSLIDINHGAFFSTWNFAMQDPCSSFTGVTCSIVDNQLRVTALFLGTGLSGSPGLAGTLSPSAIYSVTQLTQLVLYPGIVTGSIPPEIGHHLKNLRVLSLTNNRLTGTIPDSISQLQQLHTLDLSHNRLTGAIPPSLATSSPYLKVLVLADNQLSGRLPEFPGESQLIHLDVSHNVLSGMLPSTIPSTLRYLSLSSNGLWGPLQSLPSSNLVYLDLSMNKFSGVIPPSLFRPSLSSMFLQRNNLSGPVPHPATGSQSYGPGSTVDLSHNFLSGEITNILDGVETLFLNNNQFTGEVPEVYVRNVFAGTTRTLYLQHNYITEFPMDKTKEVALPDAVALCLSYNCMVPPTVGLTACPAGAGGQVSRPFRQCSVFNNGSSMD